VSGQSELRERAQLLSELRQIVQAMKNVAFAELQRVSHALPALVLARETVLCALDSVSDDPGTQQAAPACSQPALWLVIGAERGFCGAFNSRLVAAIDDLRRDDPQARLMIAGRKLADLLDGHTQGFVAIAGCSSIEDAYPALDSWLAAVGSNAQGAREAGLLYLSEPGPVRCRLLPAPEPMRRGDDAKQGCRIGTPLHYLPVPVLRSALLRQAARLLLQTGLYHSLEQENHARVMQMQRAQDHLEELGRLLRRRYARLRQAEITNELEILMTSAG